MSVASRARVSAPARERTWVAAVARIGLAARGVIYLVLAYLALDIARHGSAPTQTSSTGALQELANRRGGNVLLVVLAVGLACYAGWRLFDTVTGRRGFIMRVASLVIAVIYIGLCVQAVRLVTGHGVSGGASANPQPLVGRVLSWSGGPQLVGAVGAVLMAAGLGLAIWGIGHKYEKSLAMERVGRRTRTLIKVVGAAGDVARGALVFLVGLYLMEAAVTSNAGRSKSIDEALKALVHHPFGGVAIGVVAFGLLCFGIFSFFEARLRRVS
jgi:Domain of Unknown Function (DUF1206)